MVLSGLGLGLKTIGKSSPCWSEQEGVMVCEAGAASWLVMVDEGAVRQTPTRCG